MGLVETLGRIPKILEANINALLDKCEDPAKMIDQLLVDYKRDLVDVKRDTAAVMADVKVAEKRLQECDEDIARKQKAAENALKSGNEADARTLLAAKQSLEETRASLLQNLSVAQKNADLMREGYNKLVRNIEELEQRKDAAKAKISMAKAQEQINQTVAKAGSTVNMDAFNKYEQKAERILAEANASAELDSEVQSVSNLTEKYTNSANSASVDEELAALKAKLGMQ
ncbi:MAG: PspA/IM30 family protein [Lachnospiraceae bacterium]|nr:PspA/IM30 family protein [Lachnospiraceae bacterium]